MTFEIKCVQLKFLRFKKLSEKLINFNKNIKDKSKKSSDDLEKVLRLLNLLSIYKSRVFYVRERKLIMKNKMNSTAF